MKIIENELLDSILYQLKKQSDDLYCDNAAKKHIIEFDSNDICDKYDFIMFINDLDDTRISDSVKKLTDIKIYDRPLGYDVKPNSIIRSLYYKKPLRFGEQTLYDSQILVDISLEHWKVFDDAARSGEGFKVGDFIDNSVNLTATQLVKYIDQLRNLKTLDDIESRCDEIINELKREVDLDN